MKVRFSELHDGSLFQLSEWYDAENTARIYCKIDNSHYQSLCDFFLWTMGDVNRLVYVKEIVQ